MWKNLAVTEAENRESRIACDGAILMRKFSAQFGRTIRVHCLGA